VLLVGLLIAEEAIRRFFLPWRKLPASARKVSSFAFDSD